MKKLLLLSAAIGIIGLPAVSHAEQLSIFDGSTFIKHFGGATITQVAEQGNPAPAVSVTAGSFGNGAFGLTTPSIAPNMIDWSKGGLQLDYNAPSGTNHLYRVRLLFFRNGADVNAAEFTHATSGDTLISDGAWHTHDITFSGWTPTFQELLDTQQVDASTPIQWKIFVQGGTNGLTNVLIDNITVPAVPEPSTYAAIAGALALGVVMLRRRK